MATELEKRNKTEIGASAAEQLSHSGRAFSPDVDIFASEDEAVFVVEMPGVDKGDVNIQVDETDTLIIRGANSFKEPERRVLTQFNVGDYYRAFQLSDDYDKDKVAAKLENGLLTITVPKREEVKPRKIEITA